MTEPEAEPELPPPPTGRPDPTRGPDGLDPAIDPRATVPPPLPIDDLAVVTAALDRAEPARLAATARAAGTAAVGVCATAGATALVAALLARWAWGPSPAALVVVVALLASGVALPLFIAVRVRRLADSLAHPREALAEARDLVGRAKGSPELGRLAMGLRRRGGVRAAATTGRRVGRAGRARRAVAAGRTISAVIGLAEPDPQRHRHLVPFTPTRLRALWLAITISFWAWAAAWLVGFVAVLSLLASAVA